MANIALRNPQFKYMLVNTGILSLVCVVKIDGTVRYTLTKNLPVGATGQFDISELARDYLDISLTSTYLPQTVAINTVITSNDGLNGSGSDVASVTFDDVGFEAYGTYTDGANPEVPFSSRKPTFLMGTNGVVDNISNPTLFDIFVPNNATGKIPFMNTTSVLSAEPYNSTETFIIKDGEALNINRIDCTKYGQGTKIIFINKYGAQQDLWFFLRKDKSLARKNESFKSNTISYPSNAAATYSVSDAPNKIFNTQAKQSHKLSSGYYPEFANQYFEELLLSEYVWMETENGTIPVKVKTSSMKFKTSVSDKLIEYSIDFEEAFDYINNIR